MIVVNRTLAQGGTTQEGIAVGDVRTVNQDKDGKHCWLKYWDADAGKCSSMKITDSVADVQCKIFEAKGHRHA